MYDQGNIDLDDALQLAAIVSAKAKEFEIGFSVAILDSSGVTVLVHRMSGAPLMSVDIAREKAYMAVGLGSATTRFRDAAADSTLMGAALNSLPRRLLFGGGAPIRVDGQLVGAVGVAGGAEEQDIDAALAAVESFGEM